MNNSENKSIFNWSSYLGFYMLGALKHSFESGFIDYHNLKHIYGISVGSIMGVFTAMNMDWNMLTDYAIETLA